MKEPSQGVLSRQEQKGAGRAKQANRGNAVRTALQNGLMLGACFLIIWGLSLLGMPCLFLTCTGHPCPGCGMTRALLCALRGDFAGAFSFHCMFWALPILVLALLFPGRVLESAAGRGFLILCALGFLFNWWLHFF